MSNKTFTSTFLGGTMTTESMVNKHDLNGVLEFLSLTHHKVDDGILLKGYEFIQKLSGLKDTFLVECFASTEEQILLSAKQLICHNENEDMFLAFLVRGFQILQSSEK